MSSINKTNQTASPFTKKAAQTPKTQAKTTAAASKDQADAILDSFQRVPSAAKSAVGKPGSESKGFLSAGLENPAASGGLNPTSWPALAVSAGLDTVTSIVGTASVSVVAPFAFSSASTSAAD
jgi:hypothetical protein